MTLEFTPAQIARLTAEAEAEYFAPFYEEVDEDEAYSDYEYSWNRYTETNDCEDWDQQDGTWGYVGEFAHA